MKSKHPHTLDRALLTHTHTHQSGCNVKEKKLTPSLLKLFLAAFKANAKGGGQKKDRDLKTTVKE